MALVECMGYGRDKYCATPGYISPFGWGFMGRYRVRRAFVFSFRRPEPQPVPMQPGILLSAVKHWVCFRVYGPIPGLGKQYCA